jgi:anti-sigma-K factor RskA
MWEALAVAWAIDSLEPADQVIFEEHQSGCVTCERVVLATLEVAAELAYGVPDIEPPPQLRRRILAAATPRPPIQATSPEGAAGDGEYAEIAGPAGHGKYADIGGPEGRGEYADRGGPAGFAALDLFGDADRTRESVVRPGSAGHRRPRGSRLGRRVGAGPARNGSRSAPRRRRIVSVLAAAALVGISAVTTWEVTRPPAVTAPVAAPDRTAVLSPPAGQGTVATVVVRGGQADVVTDALSPNAEGRQFYMWGVPAGGTGGPQVVGTFSVTTSGLHSYPVQLIRSLESYPVLAISEEAAGSTPASPSGVIARGALVR